MKSRQRSTVAGISTLHALHDGMSDGFSVLLPLVMPTFGLNYAQAASLRTMFHGALTLLQVPAGIIAERIDPRLVLALGTVAAGICFALLSIAPSYVVLLLLALAAGAGSAVQHPLASTLVSSASTPQTRRSALGVYNFAGDVGKMAGAFAIATLAAYVGWQSGVVLYGIAVALAGVVALLLLWRTPTSGSAAKAKASQSGASGLKGLGLKDPRGFWLLGSINVIDGICRAGFTTFLPFLLLDKGGSIGSVGIALSLLFAGGALGKLTCGFLGERFGILRTVVVTEVATGLLILAVVAAPLTLAMIALLPLGIALNGTSSVLYGSVADFVHEERQPRAFGFFYTISSLASALGPISVGLASDLSSVTMALAGAAVLVLLTLPLAMMLGPHLRMHQT